MIGYFAEVAPNGRYVQCHHVALPIVDMIQPSEQGNTLVAVEAPPATWAGATPTEVLYLIDGVAQWVETATIADLVERKNSEINSAREKANTDTFSFMGKEIRCRPLDRSDIDGTNGYVALFGEFPDGWAGGWKAADNSYVPIASIADWKAFYKAMVDTGNANFKRAQQLKSLLAAAETPEQIAAIKWEATDAE